MIDLLWCSLSSIPFLEDFVVLSLVTKSDHLSIAVCLSQFDLFPALKNLKFEWKLMFEFLRMDNYKNCIGWRSDVAGVEGGNVDLLIKALVSKVRKVSQSLGMKKAKFEGTGIVHRSKPSFENDCHDAKRKLSSAHQNYRDLGFDVNEQGQYICAQNVYKKCLTFEKKLYEELRKFLGDFK